MMKTFGVNKFNPIKTRSGVLLGQKRDLTKPKIGRCNLQISNALNFEAAPIELIVGGGIFVLASAGFLISEAVKASNQSTMSPLEEARESAPEEILRENSVLVFGATGRSGRTIVQELLKSGRMVVAAVRDAEKAKEVFEQMGLKNGKQQDSMGTLFVESGVDVTRESTLTSKLFDGVSQVVCATGAVFGRDSEGNMGYLNGMSPEKVDAQGVAAIAKAASMYLKKQQRREKSLVMPMKSEQDLARWERLDDVIMGGKSSSELKLEANGDGFTWSGELIVEGGGFCGARSLPAKMDLSKFDGICLKVRGHGQTLKLNIKTDDLNEPEDTYQATFDVPEDGEWATVFLPWHSFVPVKRARAVPGGAPLNPSCIRQFGLVYSRFSFNGFANPNYEPGPFQIEFQKGIEAYVDSKPQIVLISSAGVERNAIVGDDQEARKKDIPIVQLNPGGVLNYKYDGENAVRASGLPYAVVRPTGMSDDAGASGPALLEMSQGDKISGKISREEVAMVVSSALSMSAATSKTFEVRRSEAGDAQGKSPSFSDILQLYLGIEKDDNRTRRGIPPFPSPAPPPPPVTEERKEEILSDPRVQAATARGAGGRIRDAEEADKAESITPISGSNGSYEGPGGAREWIKNWKAKQQETA